MPDEGPDLEPLEAWADEPRIARLPRNPATALRHRRSTALIAVLVIWAIAVPMVAMLEIRELRHRIDRLHADGRRSAALAVAPVAAAPPAVVGRTASHYFCVLAPLVGYFGYAPARSVGSTYTDAGKVIGDVAGFRPSSYVLVQWVDESGTPARTVMQMSLRSDSSGAVRFRGEPSLIPSGATVTEVVFSAGTSDRDAQRFGPPAYPC